MKHSKGFIFVCPERTFKIDNGNIVEDQEFPIDFWTEEGCCTCCGKKKEDIDNEE